MRNKPIVLIIEDEELITQMYVMKLEKDGYQCEVAYNGAEGVQKAKEVTPDIILCDIMMPDTDGITTLEMIKKDKKLTHIPFVMLTNLSEPSYVQKALELGATSYMIKSDLTPAEVVKKVKQILKGSGKIPLTS